LVVLPTGKVERWRLTLLGWDFQPAHTLNKQTSNASRKKRRRRRRRRQQQQSVSSEKSEKSGVDDDSDVDISVDDDDEGYEEDEDDEDNDDDDEGEEEDEDNAFVLPERFLMAENGDYAKGLQRWKDTEAWRLLKDADNTLHKPHPGLCLVKECYPHFFHGRCRQGHVVYYELPGNMDYPRLKRAGISKDQFVDHVMYLQEYLWTVLQPAQEARVVLVLDLANLSLGTCTNKDVVGILKGCIGMTSAHYPARSHKMIVCNVPNWFGIAFNIVKPLLNDAQRAKINIFRAHEVLEGMRSIIPDDQIPREYGGSCTVPLGHDEMEQGLRRQVFANLDLFGVGLEVDDEMSNPDGTRASLDKYVYSPRNPKA